MDRVRTHNAPTAARLTVEAGGHRRLSRSAAFLILCTVACAGDATTTEPADDGPGVSSNPVPTIASISRTEATAGSASFVLTVTGTGYITATVVMINGQAYSPVSRTTTVLEVVMPEAVLAMAGTFTVAVSNPPPGGGISNGIEFNVINPVPVLDLLTSNGAVAGSSGFSMTVHGRDFVDGATINWNGQPRATQFVSRTRLRSAIPASDLATPAEVAITVTNPPPAGGTSAKHSISVRPLPSVAGTTVLRVPFTARDMIADPARGVLYASVPGAQPVLGNQVVRIDPESGSVLDGTFVGSDPGRLAMSDEGGFLYVGLDGAGAVRRVRLDGFVPELQWSLPAGEIAGEIVVLATLPGTVAISRDRPTVSPAYRGVTIYDNGVARPLSTPEHTGASQLVGLATPDRLYGYNDLSTGFQFYTIAVTANGASNERETQGLIGRFRTDLVGAAGRVYGSDGSIVDAERHERVGSLTIGHAILPDPVTGRVYVLVNSGIDVFDMNTFASLGTIPVSGYEFAPPADRVLPFVRWGADGLAFLDRDELFIVRSPIVGT
jgi:hypothetical protein